MLIPRGKASHLNVKPSTDQTSSSRKLIPTITERESNARRLVASGAGEIVMSVNGADGEKRIDVAEVSAQVRRVLCEPVYRRSARRVAEPMQQFGGAQGGRPTASSSSRRYGLNRRK